MWNEMNLWSKQLNENGYSIDGHHDRSSFSHMIYICCDLISSDFFFIFTNFVLFIGFYFGFECLKKSKTFYNQNSVEFPKHSLIFLSFSFLWKRKNADLFTMVAVDLATFVFRPKNRFKFCIIKWLTIDCVHKYYMDFWSESHRQRPFTISCDFHFHAIQSAFLFEIFILFISRWNWETKWKTNSTEKKKTMQMNLVHRIDFFFLFGILNGNMWFWQIRKISASIRMQLVI